MWDGPQSVVYPFPDLRTLFLGSRVTLQPPPSVSRSLPTPFPPSTPHAQTLFLLYYSDRTSYSRTGPLGRSTGTHPWEVVPGHTRNCQAPPTVTGVGRERLVPVRPSLHLGRPRAPGTQPTEPFALRPLGLTPSPLFFRETLWTGWWHRSLWGFSVYRGRRVPHPCQGCLRRLLLFFCPLS